MGAHVATGRSRGRDDPPRVHHHEDDERDAGEGEDDRPGIAPKKRPRSCHAAMLSDDLQNLRDVDVLAIPIPPPLLAVVTCEEQDLGPVGEDVLDLDHIRFVSTVDSSSRLETGDGTWYNRRGPYNNASSSRRRPT